MHTEHPFVQRVSRRHRRKSEQRTTAGDVRLFHEAKQLASGIPQLHPLSDQDQRTLSGIYQADSFRDSLFVCLRDRHIAADKVHGRRFVFDLINLGVLGEIEHHRSGASAPCDVKGTRYCPGDIFCPTYLVAPLRDRLGNTHQIDLLKRIAAQELCTYLPGNHDDWRTIYHGIGYTRDGIRGSRPTGNEANTYLARNPGKALRRMSRPLFMTDQNMIQLIPVIVQRIKDRHDRTSRITEQRLHALVLQGTH